MSKRAFIKRLFPNWGKKRQQNMLNSIGDELYDRDGNLVPYEIGESLW